VYYRKLKYASDIRVHGAVIAPAEVCTFRLFYVHCVSLKVTIDNVGDTFCVPDIIDCNLKKDYQMLIIFGTNIPDTTGHQVTVQVPTSPKLFLHYRTR